MPSSDASATIEIAASPEHVYALITDLDILTELAAETEAMHWTTGTSAQVGARFRGTNRNGRRRWSTTCTVVDADPGHRFAFEVTHPPALKIARWQYDITASPTGCVVTESTVDRRPALFKPLGGMATGQPDRGAANREHIATTLQRLKVRAES